MKSKMRSKININGIVHMNAMYTKKWLELLCNNEERLNEFIKYYLDMNRLWESLCRFQVRLKREGRGQFITLERLQQCINKNDDIGLKKLLEELLLIPVNNQALKILKQRDDLKDFIERIKENEEITFVSFSGDALDGMCYLD